MKMMRDYSRWSLEALEEKAAHHRKVIRRLRALGGAHGANRLVLAEVEQQIESKLRRRRA